MSSSYHQQPAADRSPVADQPVAVCDRTGKRLPKAGRRNEKAWQTHSDGSLPRKKKKSSHLVKFETTVNNKMTVEDDTKEGTMRLEDGRLGSVVREKPNEVDSTMTPEVVTFGKVSHPCMSDPTVAATTLEVPNAGSSKKIPMERLIQNLSEFSELVLIVKNYDLSNRSRVKLAERCFTKMSSVMLVLYLLRMKHEVCWVVHRDVALLSSQAMMPKIDVSLVPFNSEVHRVAMKYPPIALRYFEWFKTNLGEDGYLLCAVTQN